MVLLPYIIVCMTPPPAFAAMTETCSVVHGLPRQDYCVYVMECRSLRQGYVSTKRLQNRGENGKGMFLPLVESNGPINRC